MMNKLTIIILRIKHFKSKSQIILQRIPINYKEHNNLMKKIIWMIKLIKHMSKTEK